MRIMAFFRSVLHMLWMLVTVIPWGIIMCVASIWRRGEPLYWMAERWLGWAVGGARVILGIRTRVNGMENLPQAQRAGAVLLVKHQSTFETFLMPTLMPHPLAYVFKKELIYVPFFGWAMARLDMIHIDRSQRAQAFNKVVKQGRALLAQGIWIIMFPEGTRIPRGQQGTYKSGGAAGDRDRRTGDPDRRHLGQGLAAQGLRQAARRGRCVDRPRHFQRGPQARRTDARGRSVDRGRDAPARPRGLPLSGCVRCAA